MNSKKSITLSGILMYPLTVGIKAVVLSQGRFIRTSRIVAIHGRDAGEVRFETMDGKYTLLLDPLTQAAGSLPAAA